MAMDERDFWYCEGRTPLVRHMADRSYTIRAWVGDGADWDPKEDQGMDFHICRREQLEGISVVLGACQDWAPHLISGWYCVRPERELPFLPEV